MSKYVVECGSLVTKRMDRKFTISAKSEDEAIERARNRFIYECSRQRYTECGDTIVIDGIEKIED